MRYRQWNRILEVMTAVLAVAFVGLMFFVHTPFVTYRQQLAFGNRFLNAEEYEKAEAAFQKAIKISPKKPEPYIGLGNVYVRQADQMLNRFEGGELKATELTEIQELYQKARESYQAATGIDQNNTDLKENGLYLDQQVQKVRVLEEEQRSAEEAEKEKQEKRVEEGEDAEETFPVTIIDYDSGTSKQTKWKLSYDETTRTLSLTTETEDDYPVCLAFLINGDAVNRNAVYASGYPGSYSYLNSWSDSCLFANSPLITSGLVENMNVISMTRDHSFTFSADSEKQQLLSYRRTWSDTSENGGTAHDEGYEEVTYTYRSDGLLERIEDTYATSGMTDAGTDTQSFTYDEQGNLTHYKTETTDPRALEPEIRDYELSFADNMLQSRTGGAEGTVLEYAFDENLSLSKITFHTGPSSKVVEYSFDQYGRFLKESGPGGSIQVEYSATGETSSTPEEEADRSTESDGSAEANTTTATPAPAGTPAPAVTPAPAEANDTAGQRNLKDMSEEDLKNAIVQYYNQTLQPADGQYTAGETVNKTDEEFQMILRWAGDNSQTANVYVTAVSLNLTTGELKDSDGNEAFTGNLLE